MKYGPKQVRERQSLKDQLHTAGHCMSTPWTTHILWFNLTSTPIDSEQAKMDVQIPDSLLIVSLSIFVEFSSHHHPKQAKPSFPVVQNPKIR
jgi:hypothetical protein